MKRPLRRVAGPALMVLGLATAATGVEVVRTSLGDLDAQTTAPAPAATGDAESLATAFRAASRRAFPAVVHVQSFSQARNVSSRVPERFRGSPFEQFFGPQMPQGPQQSTGSGFIVSEDGYIITNNHVVADAERVTVTLTDRREFTAEVVGRDPNTDVAVLKIDGEDLPTVQLGDSDALETGDWVLALGYPLSLGETTTAGIVSAKGKSLGIMSRNEGANNTLEAFIQTDAVINPGNSGGPLIDLHGRVIGMNTAIASPTGYYNGYGFAVPISLAKRVADDLIEYGAFHRPMIGVQIRDVTVEDREAFGLESAHGVLVAAEPQSPAAEAGIRMGDVIVAVDGEPVAGTEDLMLRVARKQPGDKVRLDVVRYGDRLRTEVRLATMPGAEERAPRREAIAGAEEEAVGRLGFRAVEVDPRTARAQGLSYADEMEGAGVVVLETDPAAQVPFGRGFLVERINGREIRSLDDLRAASRAVRPGQVVTVVGRFNENGARTILNYRVR